MMLLPFRSQGWFHQRDCFPREAPAGLRKDLFNRTEQLKNPMEIIYTSL